MDGLVGTGRNAAGRGQGEGARRPLSERIPSLYGLAVLCRRLQRHLVWAISGARYARARGALDLPVRVVRHRSLLLRQLGETEMWLQHNKVHNLRLAAPRVDGLLLRPGETFSFCRTVGHTTARRGYRVGMLLSGGEAQPGIGGGICQMANLLHWLVLHSPLTVTERSEHTFDPFPDNGRVLPWGVGCAVFYNYVDLQVRNDTEATYQIRVAVGERHLEGELRADRAPSESYSVYERFPAFAADGDRYYRSNEIWRTVIDRRTGDHLRDEFVRRNRAIVTYVPRQLGPVAAIAPDAWRAQGR